jgi:hypothetical protein
MLLRELGGYTRESLEREPAGTVRRWLMIMQAEIEQRNQHRKRKGVWNQHE